LSGAEYLAETGDVSGKLEAVRVYVAQKQWETALDVCQQVLYDASADSGEQAQALLELGKAYAGADRPSDALDTYATVAERFAGSSFGSRALLESAKLNVRREYGARAVWLWQRVRNEYAGTPQAVQAQWELARSYDKNGLPEQAVAQYAKLAHDHPTSFLADDALFRAGVRSYLSNDYARAAELLVEATNMASDRLADDAPYWAGKAYLALGKTHIATHYLSRSAQVRPAGFYSYRAWAALRELSMIGFRRAHRVPLGDRWLMILPARLSTASARRKAVLAASPPTGLSEPAANLARRAAFLIEHQLPEADWDLDKLSVMNAVPDRQRLAQLFLHVGASDRCVSTAVGLGSSAGSGSRVANLLPHLYPLAHGQRVDTLASAAGLDPLLVHSVMREESHFRGTLASSAGAVGLMQVMPSTGRWIALKLELEDYNDDSLLDRDVNLALGTWYLGYLWKEFDGNLIYVVASYNGGPGNVRRWLDADNGSEDVDAFIESIPLDETRNYIKKVLGTYGNYLQLYR
jgi:soluble lytic murein transglycosylase-like protein/TolA-binding protein